MCNNTTDYTIYDLYIFNLSPPSILLTPRRATIEHVCCDNPQLRSHIVQICALNTYQGHYVLMILQIFSQAELESTNMLQYLGTWFIYLSCSNYPIFYKVIGFLVRFHANIYFLHLSAHADMIRLYWLLGILLHYTHGVYNSQCFLIWSCFTYRFYVICIVFLDKVRLHQTWPLWACIHIIYVQVNYHVWFQR